MQDLPYLDTQHLLAHGQATENYRAVRLFDPDRRWQALLYLTTLTPHLWDAVSPHLDFDADHADLEAVAGLTRGEAMVLAVGANLLRSEGCIDLAELADALDDDVWEIVLAALRTYREG